MLVSMKNTIALDAEEVRAAKSSGLNLSAFRQVQKGPYLELYFRNPAERLRYEQFLWDAFDTYLHRAVADSPTAVPDIRELGYGPTSTKASNTYPSPFYTALCWTVLWGTLFIAGLMFLAAVFTPR